ncbi:hypothetical protein VTO42DRAFT_3801 [Malbranchea cinnamomea]
MPVMRLLVFNEMSDYRLSLSLSSLFRACSSRGACFIFRPFPLCRNGSRGLWAGQQGLREGRTWPCRLHHYHLPTPCLSTALFWASLNPTLTCDNARASTTRGFVYSCILHGHWGHTTAAVKLPQLHLLERYTTGRLVPKWEAAEWAVNAGRSEYSVTSTCD